MTKSNKCFMIKRWLWQFNKINVNYIQKDH